MTSPTRANPLGKPGNTCAIQLFGDLSLDGLYCDPQHHLAVAENMQYVSDELGPSDLRVVNWESPLWGDGQVNELKHPRLATTETAARCISPLGFHVALLANNHAYDCLEAGFDATTRFFDDNGIRCLGASRSRVQACKPLVVERNGLALGLLNYVDSKTNPNLPATAAVHLNFLERRRATEEVVALKDQCDHVLVFLHWGEVEHVRVPRPEQRVLARSLVTAGATLVVGCHAHCLQGHESYEGAHVFYCLGNFLFSPFLSVPGCFYSPQCEDARRIGVPKVVLNAQGIAEIDWTYFHKDRDSLLLRRDMSSGPSRCMAKRKAVLRCSDGALSRRYRRERFQSAIRYQVSCYGWTGLLGKLCNPSKLRRGWKAIFRA